MNAKQTFDNKRWLVRALFGIALYVVLLILPAGRWDWWAAWGYIAIHLVVVLVTAYWLDPDLLAERESRRKTNQKEWDKVVFALYGLLSALVMPLLAGFNLRYGWQPGVPTWLQLVGTAAVIFSWWLQFWAMRVNRFFAKVARIQDDRGQTVCDRGPYRIVRHPGYVGGVLLALGGPLMLGSWWALLAGVGAAIFMIVRTALEDRMLMNELPGYIDYAQRVRHRLLPGIW